VFRGAVAAEQHAALLDCALSRDADRACRLLEAHLRGCVEHVARTGALQPYAARRTHRAVPMHARRGVSAS
jgi:DNA-binding GntR family transcriptional regulator